MGLGSDELSKIMGRATLVNGFVATAAGVSIITLHCFTPISTQNTC